MELLELLEQPAFCVRDGKIQAVNHAAKQRQILPDIEIAALLPDHLADYQSFTDGILYLNVCAADIRYDATVTRTEQGDIFLLDTQYAGQSLQAMALAAQHLRAQLSAVMSTAQEHPQEDKNLIRGLYRLQRSVCNMSDVAYYRSSHITMDTLELGSVVYEIIEKAANLLKESGLELHYTGLRERVFTAGNYELLERAIYNLLSNAAKFSPKDGTLKASLVKKSNSILFTLENSGESVSSHLYSTLFARYQRQPGIEDGSQGIGLGMALVQSAAAIHGGTVLVTKPENGGTRVTLSIAIRPQTEDIVRTPTVNLSDYAGGNDHALLELSDVLPAECYTI